MTGQAGTATVEADIRVGGVSMGKGAIDIPVTIEGATPKPEVHSDAFMSSLAAFLRNAADTMEQAADDIRQLKAQRQEDLLRRLIPSNQANGGG
jgi:hypothetical protein